MGPFIIAAVIVVLFIIIISNIAVVQQSRAYVIERLGAFQSVWGVGLHFKVPFIDRIARRVSLKEQVLDYPPQPVITKDNVTMQIDTVVYFQITASLANHPVCLSSEGELSVEMEKVLRKMPGADGEIPKASVILEINMNHPIKEKLFNLFANDRSALEKYAKILYSEACLISGISIENPSELCELISELMLK